VLADTYFPGWSARVTSEDRKGNAMSVDVPILPANGVMRAIPLPNVQYKPASNPNDRIVTIEMRYRPWPWRIGAAISLGAGCLFLILVGLTIIKGRNGNSAGESWPN